MGLIVRQADAAVIEDAARRLAAGEVVALPTETVYGLGADAGNRDAVAAIYRIKGRPPDHPLIVHVADAAQARWWGEIDEVGERLIAAFWPGPLTLIVRRRAGVPDFACGGEATVGLRCPAHPVAQALLQAFARRGGHGVAAPSANRFGRVSPTRAEHVADDLAGFELGALQLVVDGGPCEVGLESTIIDLSRGAPVMMRPGGVPADALAALLDQALRTRDAAAPRAPGTLAAHYAPRTPLEILDAQALVARAEVLAGQGLALWCQSCPSVANLVHWEPFVADPERFARELYDRLRRLDTLGADRILVERPPSGVDWDAVRDRLARAAASFTPAR